MTAMPETADPLDQHDHFASLGTAASPEPPLPDATLARAVRQRCEEQDQLATALGRYPLGKLRTTVPTLLRAIEQRFAVQFAPIEQQLARIPGNDKSAGAQAARYLLNTQRD